jgi:hypothetical protein
MSMELLLESSTSVLLRLLNDDTNDLAARATRLGMEDDRLAFSSSRARFLQWRSVVPHSSAARFSLRRHRSIGTSVICHLLDRCSAASILMCAISSLSSSSFSLGFGSGRSMRKAEILLSVSPTTAEATISAIMETERNLLDLAENGARMSHD